MRHLFVDAERAKQESVFDEIENEAKKSEVLRKASELFYDLAEKVHDILSEDLTIPPKTSIERDGIRATITFEKVD